MRTISEEDLK